MISPVRIELQLVGISLPEKYKHYFNILTYVTKLLKLLIREIFNFTRTNY